MIQNRLLMRNIPLRTPTGVCHSFVPTRCLQGHPAGCAVKLVPMASIANWKALLVRWQVTDSPSANKSRPLAVCFCLDGMTKLDILSPFPLLDSKPYGAHPGRR